MNTLEQQIINETKGLSPISLGKILGFIQFIRQKELKGELPAKHDTDAILREMENHELTHLGEEFENYKERYPYER
jgi:hypothetical protein